jgi:hypothetical protein
MSQFFYYCALQVGIDLACSGSIVVDHLPPHPKVEGLSPDVPATTRGDKMAKKIGKAIF